MKATTRKAFELFLLCVLEESENKHGNLTAAANNETMSFTQFDKLRAETESSQKLTGEICVIMNNEFKKLEKVL